jgi:predicted Zn-dependent protease
MKKAVLGSLIIVFGCLALWFYGRPAYRHYRETRAIERARKALSKGDYRNASLSARQALQANPVNLEACQIMADLAERSRSPFILDWRRRIVEVAPTIPNKLLLAVAALHMQGPPYPLATQTLDDLKDSATGVAAYHAVAAELALRLKRPAEAAAQFEQASRFEPTNELHQLNLAVLRLQSTNAEAASAAQATLEGLRASTNVGFVALRWLVAESLDLNDLSSAERFSRQLLANAHSAPDDRLQHLTILQRSNNPELKTYLAALQKNSLTNAAEVYGISAWMVGHGMVGDALAWLTDCPAKLRAEQPVPLALVDCYVTKKDWPGLETSLEEQKWGELEFLRFAFLSRSAAELNHKLAADSRWHTAIREADDRLGALTALMTMATTWGRVQAREELLWHIAQHFPRERWTLRELERLYLAAGNTHGLNKVYSTMASYVPDDLVAKNNLAATSLLLRLNLPKAHELAKEVYTQHPKEAIVPSASATYAFSLHLQGRTKEGLGVLEKLKPDALQSPSVALYYGLLLSASGETNKARKYLDIAQKADLLPEEKALVNDAGKQSGPRS